MSPCEYKLSDEEEVFHKKASAALSNNHVCIILLLGETQMAVHVRTERPCDYPMI